MQLQTIYIPLQNEGTEVWRPVMAEAISPALFRISEQAPGGEEWPYAPRQAVAVEQHRFDSGEDGLIVTQAAPYARLDLSKDELRIIHNALNEVCNGLALEGEFDTRMGSSRDLALVLLERISGSGTQAETGARRN